MAVMPGRATVIVRLSDVPLDLRMKVADQIVKRGALRGLEAAELMLAAHRPVENPILRVTPDKATRVIKDGRLPLGDMPKVWTW